MKAIQYQKRFNNSLAKELSKPEQNRNYLMLKKMLLKLNVLRISEEIKPLKLPNLEGK